jgi:hypothetical protein
MLDSRFIYDVDATTLPLSKDLLKSCIDSKPIFSFVLCKYENLITTINTINRSPEISGTLNGNVLFDTINSPETSYDCVIKIEGLKSTEDNYLNNVLRSNENCTWTDFKTYSSMLRSEIKGMKETVFKKALWNKDNIDSWFDGSTMQLPDSVRDVLTNDWNVFKVTVIRSKDLDSFISACSDDMKNEYISLIYKNAKNLLDRYKVELMAHVQQQNKNDETVTITKPVVSKIYIMSNNYARCQKEWPTLRVSPLNKKNLETLGLYL